MKTILPKVDQNQKKWHVVDADGVVLGRLASKVADVLRGKDKPIFTPHLDAGDFVVVINAEKVRVTGNKEEDKTYHSFSGWAGGHKEINVSDLRDKHPERLVYNAVKGMVPHNRLGRQIMTKLKVYKGGEHKHGAQKPETLTIG
jgi:large subunit ribosomal protein L13